MAQVVSVQFVEWGSRIPFPERSVMKNVGSEAAMKHAAEKWTKSRRTERREVSGPLPAVPDFQMRRMCAPAPAPLAAPRQLKAAIRCGGTSPQVECTCAVSVTAGASRRSSSRESGGRSTHATTTSSGRCRHIHTHTGLKTTGRDGRPAQRRVSSEEWAVFVNTDPFAVHISNDAANHYKLRRARNRFGNFEAVNSE